MHTESLARRMTDKEEAQPGNPSHRNSLLHALYDARNVALKLQSQQACRHIEHLNEAGLSRHKHSIEPVVWSQPGYHAHRLLRNKLLGLFCQIWRLFPVKRFPAFVGTPPCAGQLLARLIQAGIPVNQFGEVPSDLEDAFLSKPFQVA